MSHNFEGRLVYQGCIKSYLAHQEIPDERDTNVMKDVTDEIGIYRYLNLNLLIYSAFISIKYSML